jgi:hypothetical protein
MFTDGRKGQLKIHFVALLCHGTQLSPAALLPYTITFLQVI